MVFTLENRLSVASVCYAVYPPLFIFRITMPVAQNAFPNATAAARQVASVRSSTRAIKGNPPTRRRSPSARVPRPAFGNGLRPGRRKREHPAGGRVLRGADGKEQVRA